MFMDIYVPEEVTEWVEWNVGGFPVVAPKFLAERHERSTWEVERFASMQQHLKSGMTLFDVGAEQGYMSAIYARFVGGENMVLFEPVPQSWVNIRTIWEHNGLPLPKGTYCGFVGNKSVKPELAQVDYATGFKKGWPVPAWGDHLLDATKFRYLDEHQHSTTTTTLDDWALENKIAPDAITIDIEGFEVAALQGAEYLLHRYHPLVWVSVHPEMMANRVGTNPQMVHDIMANAGYVSTHLATDHEEHWFYEPRCS